MVLPGHAPIVSNFKEAIKKLITVRLKYTPHLKQCWIGSGFNAGSGSVSNE